MWRGRRVYQDRPRTAINNIWRLAALQILLKSIFANFAKIAYELIANVITVASKLPISISLRVFWLTDARLSQVLLKNHWSIRLQRRRREPPFKITAIAAFQNVVAGIDSLCDLIVDLPNCTLNNDVKIDHDDLDEHEERRWACSAFN